MSSDVSSETSDDDKNSLIKKPRNSFNKLASKGWSTCSEGFEKNKENPRSETRLSSSKWSSPSTTNNILRTIQRKKGVKSVYRKYSGIPAIQLQQFLKENIDVDPHFTSKGTPEHCSSTIVHYQIENDYKQQGSPKVEKSKLWTLTNFEDSFKIPPASNKPSLNVIWKKRPSADESAEANIKIDSSQSNEENIVDIGSFGTDSCPNGQSEDILVSHSSQVKSDPHQFVQRDRSSPLLDTPKCSFVRKYQNSVNKHKIERSVDNSSDNVRSPVLQKGSDWLKSIEWPNQKSIHSSSNCADHSEEKGYGIKSPKFVPGGLAEQAAKLEKKVRHNRLIWSHQKRDKPNGYLEKCLTIRVGPFHAVYGLMLSKCLILNKSTVESNNAKLNTSPHGTLAAKEGTVLVSRPESAMSDIPVHTVEPSPNVNAYDAIQDIEVACKSIHKFATSENSVDIERVANSVKKNSILSGEHYFLLLKPSIMTEFKFAVGSIIRLHPPWQSLDVPNLPYLVILCPYYIDVLDACKLPENSVKHIVKEDVIFQNYEHQKDSHLDETAVSGGDWTKQSKPLDAASKMKDIRNFFKRPQQDNTRHKISSSITNKCEKIFTPSFQCNFQESASLNHSWNESLLDSFAVCATAFPLAARVQRIWEHSSSDFRFRRKSVLNTSTCTSNSKFTLLVQDENSRFFVLHLLNFQSMPKDSWTNFLCDGEGKYFCFRAVKITQILQPSRYPALFSILKDIEGKQRLGTQQDYVPRQSFSYQLAVNCRKSSVIQLSSNTYPPYNSYEISSLNRLIQNETTTRRFSCYAKILCECNNLIYVTDKSLQKKQISCPYVKVNLWSYKEKLPIRPGLNVLITEAVVQKDSLFVDKYSTVTPLLKTENGVIVNKPVTLDMVNEISSLSQSNYSWKVFQNFSEEGDLVTLKGIIQSVDEDTAISWLECNICGKENLYQDTDSRIWCSVCGRMAGNPKLNMKMSVSIRVIDMLEASIVLELSSFTTKRILKIPDDVSQPKCNVQDVLHKKIGPLICFVRSRQSLQNEVKFELQEISMT